MKRVINSSLNVKTESAFHLPGPCVESLQYTASKAQSQTVHVSLDYRNVSAIVVQTGQAATWARMPYSATNVSLSLESVCIAARCESRRSHTCTDTGAQPLVSEDGKLTLTVNGEIYNHLALRASLAPDVKFKTHSDCEIILPLVRGPIVLYIHPLVYIGLLTSTRNMIKTSLRSSMACLPLSCWMNP